jgi:hypothetical protein
LSNGTFVTCGKEKMVVVIQAGRPDPPGVDFWIGFYDFLVYSVDVSDFAVFGADEGVLTVAA